MSGHHSRLSWCKQARCRQSNINPDLKSWLFDTGSLTTRLIEYCDADFSVECLSQEHAVPTTDEIKLLGMQPRQRALIRQVLLKCGTIPVVYARTIIPFSSLRGELQGLTRLGNKSLGSVLFSDKSMRRGDVEVASLKVPHPCYQWVQSSAGKAIWGRRSIFLLKRQQLLVSEFFLPGLLK